MFHNNTFALTFKRPSLHLKAVMTIHKALLLYAQFKKPKPYFVMRYNLAYIGNIPGSLLEDYNIGFNMFLRTVSQYIIQGIP